MRIALSRRRILIACTLAALLIGGIWWLLRRRIDPRFVGTWKSQTTGVVIAFREGGSATRWIQGSPPPGELIWWVEDGRLCTAAATSTIRDRVDAILVRVINGLDYGVSRGEILELTPDTIRLRYRGTEVDTLTKIEE